MTYSTLRKYLSGPNNLFDKNNKSCYSHLFFYTNHGTHTLLFYTCDHALIEKKYNLLLILFFINIRLDEIV
jgi:hypothetical protein